MIIDPKSRTPIYLQIVEQIRQAIQAGVYRPGESLPSLRALAMEIRVNPNTVQRAYEELDRQGVIESRRGVGVFVVEREKLASRNQEEQAVVNQLQSAITLAFQHELSPSRIRELFESAMESCLQDLRDLS